MAKDSPDLEGGGNAHRAAADQLRSYVERIERLEEERKSVADDIKDVKAEAKANGYDTKTLNEILRLRKMDKAEREEREALRTLYADAIGLFD